MNNNATKKKLALNKTSLRDLTASEWQMVGGGDDGGYNPETLGACSSGCNIGGYTYGCGTPSYNCVTNTCTVPCNPFPITNTCGCTYNCVTNACTP